MKIAVIGGGAIARLALGHIASGSLGDVRVVALAGRNTQSKGRALAEEFGVPFVVGLEALAASGPEVVVEAASHEAVREYGEALLQKGISFVALSGGALADDGLRDRLELAAARHGALLYVPSGGIGGLDALKAATLAGAEEVSITVAKPPGAWTGIPYVEKLGVNLGNLTSAAVLFEGSAREGVPHFPANVNIAAVLSMAGIGFDRTRLRVVADPALVLNTHSIVIRGMTGRVELRFESVAMPDNPRTSMLACYAALAAIRELGRSTRYGT